MGVLEEDMPLCISDLLGTNFSAKMASENIKQVEFSEFRCSNLFTWNRDQWREESFLPHPSQLKLKRTRWKGKVGLKNLVIQQ